MKFGHNFCADIPELITRVSESQHLSKKTKEIMFSKLDDVYYKMLEADVDANYDFYRVWNDINENFEISDSEKEIIDFLCFTRTRRFTESTYLKELDITEAVKPEKKIKDRVPIFFIFNGGNNILSRSIMLFTQSNFSHVSLSTSGLDEIISFATTSQNFGLVVENWFDFCHIRKPKYIGVHFIDVPLEEYRKIKNSIEFHKAHTKEYYYSFKKLFAVPFQPVLKYNEPNGYICSEFVNYIVNGTSIAETLPADEANKIIITPKDFKDKISKKSTVVYEGLIENFNPETVKYVYNLYDESILKKKEAIDKELIKKYEPKQDAAGKKIKQLRIKLNK